MTPIALNVTASKSLNGNHVLISIKVEEVKELCDNGEVRHGFKNGSLNSLK